MVEKCWAVKTKNDPMVIPSYETISFTLPTMEKTCFPAKSRVGSI